MNDSTGGQPAEGVGLGRPRETCAKWDREDADRARMIDALWAVYVSWGRLPLSECRGDVARAYADVTCALVSVGFEEKGGRLVRPKHGIEAGQALDVREPLFEGEARVHPLAGPCGADDAVNLARFIQDGDAGIFGAGAPGVGGALGSADDAIIEAADRDALDKLGFHDVSMAQVGRYALKYLAKYHRRDRVAA